MESKLDVSGMFALHEALRRPLVQVARIATKGDGEQRYWGAIAAGLVTLTPRPCQGNTVQGSVPAGLAVLHCIRPRRDRRDSGAHQDRNEERRCTHHNG
jgi:hypothetical protein